MLEEVLKLVRYLKEKHQFETEKSDVWQAYLASKKRERRGLSSSC